MRCKMTFSGIFLFLFFISATAQDTYPCNLTQAIEAFKQKILLNPFPPFKNDPYQNQTIESLQLIDATLQNTDIVCALKYKDPSKRRYYNLQEFADAEAAQNAGYIVTHQGRCGTCSSLQDLAVYLERPDLTTPVRKCAILTVISNALAFHCIKKLAWITGEPNNNPDGSLNACLQCDEDQSGPVFKYFAGRTRRNSGIVSGIDRPIEAEPFTCVLGQPICCRLQMAQSACDKYCCKSDYADSDYAANPKRKF